ncbi:MAG TPA: hypothetical protein VJK53_00540 [Candidatus Paceibacterota bacterium]
MAAKKKTAKKRNETGFEMLARLVKEGLDDVRKDMATKSDVASMYRMMATKEDVAQIRRDMATKAGLEDVEEHIMERFAPIERAVDKDSLTLVDYGVRLETLEKSRKH